MVREKGVKGRQSTEAPAAFFFFQELQYWTEHIYTAESAVLNKVASFFASLARASINLSKGVALASFQCCSCL